MIGICGSAASQVRGPAMRGAEISGELQHLTEDRRRDANPAEVFRSRISPLFQSEYRDLGRLKGQAGVALSWGLSSASNGGNWADFATLEVFIINSGERTFQDIDGWCNQAYELLKDHLLIRSDYYRTLDTSGA